MIISPLSLLDGGLQAVEVLSEDVHPLGGSGAVSQENLDHLWFPVGGGQHQGSVLEGGREGQIHLHCRKSEEMATNKVWREFDCNSTLKFVGVL